MMSRAKKDRFVHVFLPLVLLTVASCSRPDSAAVGDAAAGATGPAPTPVTLQLNWFPEAEHGGYYAALVHGYYRDEGLDVKILAGGPETPVLQQVARGAATFGVINADNILFGRAEEAPIVALMAPLQISPRCVMVHESSGIRDFSDLKNITIAMLPSASFARFMRLKVPLEGVKVVPYSGNVAQFLLNKDYAQQAYVFSEPFVARKEGGDPKVLMMSDLGFNPYTSLLATRDSRLKDDPETVRKMVTASVRGWARYVDGPEETNRYIHQVNPQMDLDILAFGAKEIKPLVLDDVAQERGIGTMSRGRWQTLADQLIESGQLKPAEAHVEAAFTDRFLPQAKTPQQK